MRIRSERHSKCDQSRRQALGAAVVVFLMISTLCGIIITWKANPPHLEVRYGIVIDAVLLTYISHVISTCLYNLSPSSHHVSFGCAGLSNGKRYEKFPSEIHR